MGVYVWVGAAYLRRRGREGGSRTFSLPEWWNTDGRLRARFTSQWAVISPCKLQQTYGGPSSE